MKKKALSPVDRFLALSDAEKDAEVDRLQKIDPKDWHPLTATQRKQWSRARRKIGRPKVGQGSKMVPVSIERSLLREADAYAKSHKLKRSQLFAQGLRMVMGKAG